MAQVKAGKKSRQGTDIEHSYTNISYLPGRDPVIEDVSTDEAKKQIVRLLKCWPIHWKKYCPDMFDGNVNLIQLVTWLFRASKPKPSVLPLNFNKCLGDLKAKIDSCKIDHGKINPCKIP